MADPAAARELESAVEVLDAAATLYPDSEETVRIQLAAPLRDITPGQAAVFYQGKAVIGGGIIE